MDILTNFVNVHGNDDTTRLILDRDKWPEIDMDLAVNCIESRRKLRGKVQEWCDEPRLIFPYKLSAEQCSSSATALYKSRLAARIISITSSPFRIADLTGGLGVDSWFFSRTADKVLYNEMQPKLHAAAVHNFKILGAGNIRCTCSTAEPGKISEILDGFTPGIIFMDPARRGEGGRKVFLIEECTPDVLTLKDEIFRICRHILIKLSPMADITMVCARLGRTCREVHVVAAGGECKELLIWMDREWDSEYTITAVELAACPPSDIASDTPSVPHHPTHPSYSPDTPSRHPDTRLRALDAGAPLTFLPSQEKAASCPLASEGRYLFEPGKALMKSGAFNIICNIFGINKLGRSTHYYFTDDEATAGRLMNHGKIFEVIASFPLDKRSIKAASQSCPQAEVTARNIPMDTDTLRRKLGCTPSDTYHIFGLKSDIKGSLLLITKKVVS